MRRLRLSLLPQDGASHLENRSVSPGRERVIGPAAANISIDSGGKMLRELVGVQVTTSQVERVSEAVGTSIVTDEQAVLVYEPPRVPTAYWGLDETWVRTRRADWAGVVLYLRLFRTALSEWAKASMNAIPAARNVNIAPRATKRSVRR